MKQKQSDILIIGAGLTGLALAYFLKNKNLNVQILEARPRLGGRIFTKYSEVFAAQEMGATWLGKKHSALVELLEELNIGVFEQRLGKQAIYEAFSLSPHQLVTLPPNDEPSYRIKGGSSSLITALADTLSTDQVLLNQVIQSVDNQGDSLLVKTMTDEFESPLVISTLPPNLLVKTVNIQPNLPAELSAIAETTHTWMGESIKVSLAYAKPFWRTEGLSGTIFSNVGPIPEMYDHANVEDNRFALKGFLNGTYFSLTKEERLALVLKQLHKYYGEQVNDYLAYEEAVWRNDPYTFANYDSHILPHQNNGHPIYQNAFFDGKLWIAGSETAAQFPGYMEGAVRSAKFVSEHISDTIGSI